MVFLQIDKNRQSEKEFFQRRKMVKHLTAARRSVTGKPLKSDDTMTQDKVDRIRSILQFYGCWIADDVYLSIIEKILKGDN